jgi:hypothetical protein
LGKLCRLTGDMRLDGGGTVQEESVEVEERARHDFDDGNDNGISGTGVVDSN